MKFVLVCTQEDGIYSDKTKQVTFVVEAADFRLAAYRFRDIYLDGDTDPSTELIAIINLEHYPGDLK